MKAVYGINPTLERLGSVEDAKAKLQELTTEDQSPLATLALRYQIFMLQKRFQVGPIENLNNKDYPEVKRETFREFLMRTPLEGLNDAYGKVGD
jgi:hypothetical protein